MTHSDSSRARLVAYALAVAGTGLSVLLRLALFRFVGDRAPTATFFPAIILGAYIGGVRPGLLATLLSAAALNYFLTEPRYTFKIGDDADSYALGLFVLTGVVLSALAESRLRSQRRTAASERRYAVTLSSIGDGVIATDNQARVSFLNPVAEALTGWRLADAIGRPLTEVFRTINEQTRQPAEDPAAKVLRLATIVGLANRTVLLARDGREVPIDDCGAPILDDRGGIQGVVLVFRDVSQRRRAEEGELLRHVNSRLELAVRGSNIGIWENFMPDGDFRRGRAYYVNVWEQLGYEHPVSPTDHETAMAPVHPEDRAPLEEAIRSYLAGETGKFEIENRVRHTDGSYRWMLARGVAVRDAGGKPIRFVGSGIDITDLKRAEEALRASEEELRRVNARLDLAVRGSNVALWECDMPDGIFEKSRLNLINVWESLGYDPLTAPADAASAIALLVHPDDQERVRRGIEEFLASDRREYESEYRMRHKDGSDCWRLSRGV